MGQGFGYTGADSASFVKTAGWPANWSGPNLLWKRSPPIHVYRSKIFWVSWGYTTQDCGAFKLARYFLPIRVYENRSRFSPLSMPQCSKSLSFDFLKLVVLWGGLGQREVDVTDDFYSEQHEVVVKVLRVLPWGEMEFFGWTGIWFIHIYIT